MKSNWWTWCILYDGRFNYLLLYLFITGDTSKQGFKPKSINDIKVGMKVLFGLGGQKHRGTVKYVGPLPKFPYGFGVELDPGEGEYWYMNIEMLW